MEEKLELAALKVVELSYKTSAKKDGDKIKTAKLYVEFAQQYPKNEMADAALYLAALFYHETLQKDPARATLQILLEIYPESRYYQKGKELQQTLTPE